MFYLNPTNPSLGAQYSETSLKRKDHENVINALIWCFTLKRTLVYCGNGCQLMSYCMSVN